MIGHGFMGAAHSQGWRVAPRFFDLPREPEMTVIVGRDAAGVAAAARKWGWAEAATDWREVIARDDIDIVDIVTPGDTHAEIAIAALEAGKHVLCEKPLANTVAEAEAMTAAAERAAERGIRSMVGFTYRRVPATTFARDLVAAGRIGDIRQVRAEYLQDWLMDAEAPLTWRMQKERAGSGRAGRHRRARRRSHRVHHRAEGRERLGHHRDARQGAPAARRRASACRAPRRPSAARSPSTTSRCSPAASRSAGASASFEATRFRTGRKNALRIEISGSKGAIAFDLERLNELEFYDATLPETELGFRRILVTEHDHPYLAPWWPTGHMLGYEHGFSHQVYDFVTAIADGTQPLPSFADGLHVQRVLDAVERSSAAGSAWTPTGD